MITDEIRLLGDRGGFEFKLGGLREVLSTRDELMIIESSMRTKRLF